MKIFLFFLFCFNFSVPAKGQDNNFLKSVKAYQVKDYKEAQTLLSSMLEQYPKNPVLLYNLGLTEYQLGNPGLALGLWRKARYLDQNFTPAQSAILYTEEILFPESSNQSVFQTIYTTLTKAPLSIWLPLCLFSSFAFFWFTIQYSIKEKRALWTWPPWVLSLIPIIILSSLLSAQLLTDQAKIRATVIKKNLQTHTTPSESSPTLSELREGQVVNVEKSHAGWVQIRTMSGSPGWVPQESLIAFGGSQ